MLGLSKRELFQPTWLWIYSLSSFVDGQLDQPSPLPLELFRHVTATLAVDCFDVFRLAYSNPQRCPVDFCTRFLSVIPQGAPSQPKADDVWTTYALCGMLTRDDLQAIFSHRFPRTAKLTFDSSFDESVSLTFFNELVREAPFLRAVGLPKTLVEEHVEAASVRFEEIIFNSPDKSIHYSRGKLSPVLLQTIAATHTVKEVRITLLGFRDAWQDFLRSYIQPFLRKDATLERLSICFDFDEMLPFRPTQSEQVRPWVPAMADCTSRKLVFLNVVVNHGAKTWNVGRVQQWDQLIFPSLSLNFYRSRMSQSARGGVIPPAIKAVNEGNVYRKTTHHAPSDMSTTNAGLIFKIVKAQAVTGPGFKPNLLAVAA
jgi:hypothetical protein